MFIGIGTLILAKHPALRSLAEVTIIGMGTVVLMAYCLPPLVFRWLVRGSSPSTIHHPPSTIHHPPSAIHSSLCKPLPITLKRVLYSLFAMGFFLSCMYLFVLPYTWLYFHFGKDTEQRRLKYHAFLQRLSDFVIHRVPGVKFYLENRVGESFERPAVVISNHQSHLDLMCLMMLTPKIVFLTNDWVWNNPFYGMVIHKAEFYPVSNGIENHVQQLQSLYERGYSICVFPEGTRSPKCEILRFHKGAFALARELDADILPIFIHGMGHVLPKEELMFRGGDLYLEIAERVRPYDSVGADTDSERDRLVTRQMRHYYQEHYAEICASLETEEYWRFFRKYQERYKLAVSS
jgi:1-acyl-sn-glycerol-3-phosphate acyltransferase